MEKEVLNELLEEPLILQKAKLEAFLAPALGLRPASQVTIPAELPMGVELGRRIDAEVKPQLMKLRTIKDMRKRTLAINAVKKLLEKQFEVIVEASEAYKTYCRWTDKFALHSDQIKVRPTVHELYFFKKKTTGLTLRKLVKARDKIRRNVQRKGGPEIGKMRFAYPEEFDKQWLLRNGDLLGYPDCCVEQYAEDRSNGVNVEARASEQLLNSLREGEVDSHVYYTGLFFPCTPHCEDSLARGNKWHDSFRELDIRFSNLYESVLTKNLEIVLRQPELIAKYLGQFKK